MWKLGTGAGCTEAGRRRQLLRALVTFWKVGLVECVLGNLQLIVWRVFLSSWMGRGPESASCRRTCLSIERLSSGVKS